MLKGSLLKENQTVGVMKVVNKRESSHNGTCQTSELASSLENT